MSLLKITLFASRDFMFLSYKTFDRNSSKEIFMMIGYGDICRSQIKVTNIYNLRHTNFPKISQGMHSTEKYVHVNPFKREPHFVLDDLKLDVV